MEFFGDTFAGEPFQLFGKTHLMALGALSAIVIFLVFLKNNHRPKLAFAFRIMAALVLIMDEIAYHMWNANIGQWTLQKMLPLHLCSVFVWLSAWMLLTRSYRIYEFAYFLGIGGALQVVLTPDIGQFNFPHFRYFQVFLSHGLIICSALYMTLVENMRPTPQSFKRVFIWLNVYMVIVYLINLLVGGNYLYLMHKPETVSLLDALGPWPLYIVAGEVVATLTFVLLYLPFWVMDLKTKSGEVP